ncbi:MAG: response regulator [Lachnospiraceae bacterium]|nr:response regulator [Lachnospiraceae bacterium]
MVKVLLIGKMNDLLKDINLSLSKHFNVQLSSENPSVALSMIDVVEPNVVIISLVGALNIDSELFEEIRDMHPDVPVLTVGTKGEENHFREFYGTGQFINLVRPLENSDIIKAVCNRLGMTLQEAEEGNSQAEEGQAPKKQVLVVDDNAGTLRSIKAMLDKHYTVSIAPSGIKAMTFLGKSRPDLIILDYEMPVVDGKQTLEMIRSDPEIKDIPVIFLTGVSDREHIEAVLKLKPSGYMLKPPVPEKLIEAIEKATNK